MHTCIRIPVLTQEDVFSNVQKKTKSNEMQVDYSEVHDVERASAPSSKRPRHSTQHSRKRIRDEDRVPLDSEGRYATLFQLSTYSFSIRRLEYKFACICCAQDEGRSESSPPRRPSQLQSCVVQC